MTNKHFLQTIYDTIHSMGLVQSQYEFGRLCGRQESWLSCAKSVDREMSVGAMISLAVSLSQLPADRVPRHYRTHLKQLIKSLWVLIEASGAKGAK